jgi:DNA invertase Pin-like site-specific DNA recombinase
MTVTATPASKTLRCAIYTRKSSDEGLEQSFNSLHAQREACDAYIRSQVSEGWTVLPNAYDDGGVSGGTMERPGLKLLLADIAAGRVDVVVVYKVDRLTRSLTDFARIVEAFDKAGVSFVSVTQAFNTTTSMGRLTLNVLLSFAQFEREVTGERIRDKIRLSKQKGMWMGAVLPLGYDARENVLIPNPAEAERVRAMFARYLELGSVHALCAELNAQGVRSKAWVTSKGRKVGGATFSRGALFHLLRNRHYIGEIVHRDQTYPGLHLPIVDAGLFEAVQKRLDAQKTRGRRGAAKPPTSLLTGRVFDGEGRRFSPTFSTGRSGRIHRYYVAADIQQGRTAGTSGSAVRRVGAEALERVLSD